MGLIKRGTPEEKEAQAKLKASEQAAKEREKLRTQFFASPAGQARVSFERGDQVFQYSLDVHRTNAVVLPMIGAYTSPKSTTDPSDILNSVCNEGWELVNGSFVFLELGSESRDKFLASGQQVAIKGSIIAYYLFKRAEANKREGVDPWENVGELAAI
jgi:hypothetical protein